MCQPDTGRCIYEFKENGIVCDDDRPYTVGDRCENGLCIGHIVDLCAAVTCRPLDDCHMTPPDGGCDKATGYCKYDPKENGTPCNDGDDITK